MKLSDCQPGQRVRYMPQHAFGDEKHKDVEIGEISSVNHKYAFVRFDKYVRNFGWEGATSQACDPEQLEPVDNRRLTP